MVVITFYEDEITQVWAVHHGQRSDTDLTIDI
jgi:hypothetical protein